MGRKHGISKRCGCALGVCTPWGQRPQSSLAALGEEWFSVHTWPQVGCAQAACGCRRSHTSTWTLWATDRLVQAEQELWFPCEGSAEKLAPG